MLRSFGTIFLTVFIAEMGDKTQLATMLFAAEGRTKWLVFAAAGLALLLAAGMGVLVGAQIERWIDPRTLKVIAGVGFLAIGLWTLLSR
ncbi:MAG TPA: TMEM165/GDT1 family protein [Thermoanaerobaculia bacterium]|jgi:putative Ca2+/H+ antiporter (TMEM165/GDT1 family)